MDGADFDLDRSVTRAWSSFRQRLADQLDELDDEAILLIEAGTALEDEDGTAPFVQVIANGDLLHAETSSNVFLAARSQLDEQMTGALTELGWTAPEPDGGPNFSIELTRSHADRLAAITVAAFRDVWNVPHPTFLEAGEANAALGITRDSPIGQEQALPDREQIQRMVDQALTEYLGELPRKDSDGDIPVRSGTALVFIRVLDDHPLVELKSPLVVDISGRTRAAEVVADLNATWRQAKFVLIRDVVVLLLELPTVPFVARHLVEALAYISRLADDLDDELADRLGGRLPFVDQAPPGPRIPTDPEQADDLPAELVSLLHLSDGQSELTADEVAQICGNDRDRLLRLLKTSTQQEISWRRAAEAAKVVGDQLEATEHDQEADIWQGIVERLRAALRVVLVNRPGDDTTA